MTLSELFENKFRADIRYRGAAYIQAERVSITHVTADQVTAVIRNGDDHQTILLRENDGLQMHCTCVSGQQDKVCCKHLWATILAIDEGDYLTGTPRPGFVPPFLTESTSYLSNDEFWETEVDDESLNAADIGVETGTRRRSRERIPEWEGLLNNLRESSMTSERVKSSQSREREIFYEIDLEESRRRKQLVLRTSQRQRRINGQWGKRKPLKLRSDKLDEIEHEDDRRILAYLSGATPERGNWVAQQTELQASVACYFLPTELCTLILPSMAETQRLQLTENGKVAAQPLSWDDGPPWELGMRVIHNSSSDAWRLVGMLKRGDEELPIGDAAVLIPGGLVVTSTWVGRLEDFDAFAWSDLLQQDPPLEVTDAEKEKLVDRLLDMPVLPHLDLPQELRLEEVTCDPVPHLVLHSPQNVRWRQERLRGDVFFDYLGKLVPGSSHQAAVVQRDQGRCIVRNRAQESEAWSKLKSLGFRRLLDHRTGRDVEVMARDLGPAVRGLMAENWQVRADGYQIRQPSQVDFRVKSGIDWFELYADVAFDGETVAFPELLSALVRGDSTIRLDDGSLGIIPGEWFEQYGLMAGLGVAEEDHLRFSVTQAGLLDALLAAQPSVDFDDRFQEIRAKLEHFEGVSGLPEPDGFDGHLRNYQRDGVGWLRFLQDFRFGGCLADDMGLGKTIQVLALMQDRVSSNGNEKRPNLIVVPKSLLFNWQHEAARFTPELRTLEYTGIERNKLRDQFQDNDLILTTYGTLRRDVHTLREVTFDYVVLDEAQTIKNAGSQVAKAARLLQANHRLALSGTPVENHVGDLWSIFEFLNPGMLGRSSVFKSYTTQTEEQESRELLARGLRPFILRRTKQQVANELPEKVEQTIHCQMDDEQRRRYEEMRDHYRQSLMGLVKQQGLAKSKLHVLEALLRLRQVACHPALLDDSLEDESSAKLDVLCPHIEELLEEGHKALVFSQFTSMLRIVRRHFDQRNIVYEYLDGQTRDRKSRVERFQSDPDCGVFLISLKAGGLGLNLTSADYVFLLDPWWNPAVETQAIDRAHRVGQTRRVFAYRLICQDTVEERIAELQEKKRTLAEAILKESKSLMKQLTAKDIEMLFS